MDKLKADGWGSAEVIENRQNYTIWTYDEYYRYVHNHIFYKLEEDLKLYIDIDGYVLDKWRRCARRGEGEFFLIYPDDDKSYTLLEDMKIDKKYEGDREKFFKDEYKDFWWVVQFNP